MGAQPVAGKTYPKLNRLESRKWNRLRSQSDWSNALDFRFSHVNGKYPNCPLSGIPLASQNVVLEYSKIFGLPGCHISFWGYKKGFDFQ